MKRPPYPAAAIGAPLLALTLAASTASAQFLALAAPAAASPSAKNVDHAERCLAALDIAILAAESGVTDVSIEAMRRACRQGPPVASIQLSGVLGANVSARSTRPNRNQESEAAAAQAKLAKRVWRLHKIWKEQEADPQPVYEALLALVLPPDRPSDAFLYSTEPKLNRNRSYGSVQVDAKQPELIPSGAAALVEWARAADRIDELRTALEEREQLPGTSEAVLLIKAILALDESSPPEDALSLCESLAESPALLINTPNAELLFGHVWGLVERLGEGNEACQKLIAAVLTAVRTDNQWPSNQWLAFLVTRNLNTALESGDVERFQSAVGLSMSSYDEIRSGNESYVASQEASLYSQAAGRAFKSGHIKLGAACLKALSLLPDSSRYGGPGLRSLVDPTNPIMKSLLAMPRSERYAAIGDLAWNSPALGLQSGTWMNIADPIPPLFLEQLPDGPPSRQVLADGAPVISLLEWTMRDAIALGQQSDIEERITKLESNGSDDARLAKMAYQLAKEEPINLSLFTERGEQGLVLQPAFASEEATTRMDLSLVRHALADDEFADAGQALLENRIAAAAKDRRQLTLLTRFRQEKQRNQSRDGGRVTQASLRHWAACDQISRRTAISGLLPITAWAPRDNGHWAHECGPDLSHLVMRYPLLGDFTISIETNDSVDGETGIGYGGRMLELMKQNDAVWVWAIGNRSARHDLPGEALKANAVNRYDLVCSGDTVTFRVNDEFEQALGKRSEAYPFFGVSAYRYRATEFGGLSIEGDVSIPKSVEMASPTMLGWTDVFCGGSLPAMLTNLEAGHPKLNPEAGNSDWRFVDGEVTTLDREAEDAKRRGDDPDLEGDPYKEERRESFIQYLRPLCDGERVEFEFFYKPGEFSVAPCVGRIAALLDQAEVGLHWVTGAPAEWSGVEATNRVVDRDAQQPSPAQLKEDDWNTVVVRVDGDTVSLSLNGEPVYRRVWEAEAGRTFGLFHDPSDHQVRVRNLRLSGDWPENLPSDFFERKVAGNL